MKKYHWKAWLSAIRPRTLPLALASIAMGSFLAASEGNFRWPVFLLACITTVFLQILSNLANDYGDSVHGADNVHRQGPARAVQSGLILPCQMKKAMYVFVTLSFVSGVLLLVISLGFNLILLITFLVLGILCIIAAITYTSGSKPYGYAGLGDISVLIFFGIVGVCGSFFLHTGFLHWKYLLPAISCGLFSTAVLNVNNIRDIQSDKLSGKKSIPVRLGRSKAVVYHWILLITGFACAFIFVMLQFSSMWQLLFLLSAPMLLLNGIAVARKKDVKDLDPYLKQMAITTLFFVLTFGLGILAG